MHTDSQQWKPSQMFCQKQFETCTDLKKPPQKTKNNSALKAFPKSVLEVWWVCLSTCQQKQEGEPSEESLTHVQGGTGSRAGDTLVHVTENRQHRDNFGIKPGDLGWCSKKGNNY